ncbi:hypothetical protein ABENE_17150 [Asticcacaulis benevestitus DSM 16100 = ATCC BAA-896]|uniref:Nodulation protein E n=1 Tax=Asticcacaulis benevestitus DSM 16100 = ATCC BAA-896 TaxID=1121022 RepID=V4R846_9CAUL|nr:hypothetical protein ABENE_17150 [Asticcacaulis benevestitus DSM 16100 = ATCC BAA-896]
MTGRLSAWAGGLVTAEDVDSADTKQMDRCSLLALVAAREAVAMANLSEHGQLDQAGVFVGCGGGGLITSEQATLDLYEKDEIKSPTLFKTMANGPTAQISMAFGCHGPTLTYAMACSSAAHAIGEAMLAIRAGRCDQAIAGGTEAPMTFSMHRTWVALRLLSPGQDGLCRPFCYERGGLLLGEGSVFFVLERRKSAAERGAPPLATIAGYGARSDATHVTAPNADGQAATIGQAVRMSGLAAADIGHVSAHGTATFAGDISETKALKMVLGDSAQRLAVSATKSFHGHLLGAAGGVTVLASLLAVSRGFIVPTANFGTPDKDLDLDYVPNVAREHVTVKASLSNAFGFGGSNASLILTPS